MGEYFSPGRSNSTGRRAPQRLQVSGTKGVPMYGVLRGFDALETLTIVSATAFVVVGFVYFF